jgi:hypothetical protein
MRSRARGRQFREGLTVLRGAGARRANERVRSTRGGPEHAGRPGARGGGRKMRGAGSGRRGRRMPGRRGWPEMCPAGSAGRGLPREGGGSGEPAPSPGREGPGHAGAGLCRLHDNSPASCTTRHRSTDRYPKRHTLAWDPCSRTSSPERAAAWQWPLPDGGRGHRYKPFSAVTPGRMPQGYAGKGYFLANWSNSPFRTPPRNACHSSGVNRRTGPAASLLSRTPIWSPGRLATSTQLPLDKLRELLVQCKSEPSPSGLHPGIAVSTLVPFAG